VLDPPGVPAALAGRLRPLSRREWRLGSVPDPLAALEDFLAGSGLPVVRDLSVPTGAAGGLPAGGQAVGAVILLGGAVGPLEAVTAHAGAASPVPEVPDLVAMVVAADEEPGPLPAPRPLPAPGPWTGSWTRAEHAAAVETVRAAIAAGDVYQVNLVGHRRAPWDGTLRDLVEALRPLGGRGAGGLEGPGWGVVSASPETFLEVAEGVARTRPVKGTRPAGGAGELRVSAKDRAEHVMIVDLERNDLGRVARAGSVLVPDLYRVGPGAGVVHAESTVSATLAPGVGLAALLAATAPGGSVTGAPKLSALSILGRLEPVGRGPAMGALGWVGADGRIALALTIRTFTWAEGTLHLWAGSGITWSSDAAAEVAETEAKAAPLLAALGCPEGDGSPGTAPISATRGEPNSTEG
jgi:para-aminobenzoate synthetase component I